MSTTTQPASDNRRGALITVLSTVGHLAARWVTSLSGRPPAVPDEVWAELHLLPGERAAWCRMSNQDRRHSISVARRFADVHPAASRAELAGALLHDVGKVESGLGTWGRVMATLVGPRTHRFRLYHDHERLGSMIAESCGSAPVTVELVAGHGPLAEVLDRSDRA